MNWENIARTVAPTVAAGLFGPLGGVVTNIVAGFLFGPEADKAKLTPQDVANKIATLNDPADLAKLRQAEQALREFEANNDFRFAQLESSSQESARSMRLAALANNNTTTDWLAWTTVISFLVVASLVLILVGLLLSGALTITAEYREVWVAVSGLIGSILGYFSANANQVVSFYFGSSRGSAAKTDQLAQHTSEAISALGRVAQAPAPQPTAPQPQGQQAGPVVQVEQTPAGSRTTIASREPEASELVRPAAPPLTPTPPRSAEAQDQLWQKCLGFVFEREGGFADIAADHGGPTNFGITQRTLAAFRGHSVTEQEVRDLTRDEAAQIYKRNYWDVTRCGELPAGVDLCVFDSAVLCGPGTAARFLQGAAGLHGLEIDGIVGPKTLAAIAAATPRDLIEGIIHLREQHLRSIVERDPSQAQFMNGWTNRLNALRSAALAMASAG